MPIIRSPSNCHCSLWFPYECGGGSVLSRGRWNRRRLRTLPPPHSYVNQRLQRQFDGLLMMGIVIPETCWAVFARQSNKLYDWLLHLVGCFIWRNYLWTSHLILEQYFLLLRWSCLPIQPLIILQLSVLVTWRSIKSIQYTTLHEREKSWPVFNTPTLKYVVFLLKYKEKQFFSGHNLLTEAVVVTQLSGNAGT